MTALPVRPALAPEQVYLFVEQIPQRLTPVTLLQTDYLSAIRELAERHLTIYTWNLKHFRQLAPDLADRIRTPGVPALQS